MADGGRSVDENARSFAFFYSESSEKCGNSSIRALAREIKSGK